ncbi:MAG: TIGR00730 family Rossman fold protein [Proteobacteria bacterium]|nr:TIGR00730 family Rossman fold protein [Pseudomonadota bacterium]
MRICIYAAASAHSHRDYRADAHALGTTLARAGHAIVYGGGAVGSMGALADGALSVGGEVIGVIPRFMVELELAHASLSALQLVEDMRERKHRLLTGSDAVVALPGGCGTLEELFEAITLKQLGIYHRPIVLLNTRGYWTPWADFMRTQVIGENFMNEVHGAMWTLVDTVDDVLPAIANAPPWDASAIGHAVVRAR